MAKLNALYRTLAPGHPVMAADLARLGVSADLAVHYARAGWLTRLGRGIYVRPDGPLDLHASLRLLERRTVGFHVSGKTALEWHGLRHHLAVRPQLQLCGWDAAALPPWFTAEFPSRYRRLRLFDEAAARPRRVSRLTDAPLAPLVAEPERAMLELLSDVGVGQPLEDARAVVEGTTSLRSAVLQELLVRCRQVKTVRLCLVLGRELGLPWAAKLNAAKLPTGSDARWVGRTAEGLLVLGR